MNPVRGLFQTFVFTATALLAAPAVHAADGLQKAEVTRVFNKVKLLPPNQFAIAAKIGDDISGNTAVQTGSQSRAELQFNDQTIARLGANSVFSFERGTRDLNLNEGIILLEVPKNAGGAIINTAAVTAAVTGTTVIIEARKNSATGKINLKFIVLEGTMRLTLKGSMGESILLEAGQIAAFESSVKHLPEPQYVDIDHLTKTSGLMSNQFGELKNQPYIFKAINEQKLLKAKGKLITLNYGLYGKRTNPVLQVVSLNNQSTLRTDANIVSSKPSGPKSSARPGSANIVHRPPVIKPRPPVPKPPRPPRPKPPRPKPPQPMPTPPTNG